MISRRRALAPLAAALVAPAWRDTAQSAGAVAKPGHAPLPDRYDEPLGIGLEGWPYPAPVHWQPCTVAGQLLRMAYMDVAPTGKSRNRIAVLLGGKNFDSSYWAAPIKDLAAAGFRVIVPDQIGFHKSSKPDIDYSLDLLTGLTVNLLSGQQIGKVSLIGHSLGGMLAVRLAATYPDKVDRLILEGPVGLVDYRRYIPPQPLDTLVAAERRRTIAVTRALLRADCPLLPPQQLEPFVEWRMRVAQSGEYERFCKAAALTTQMIYRESVRDEFSALAGPTLLIVGEKDSAAPLKPYALPDMAAKMPSVSAAAPAIAHDIKKGSLVVLPGAGHVPHLEVPDAFRKATLDFLLG